ncbi:hypothetical protein [Stieleria varia]|uniref:Uncharacterized protein n=1 Tax=Stieleria varia TaxID=2528005 RepID=A0A5C6AWE0_9BACT|nr:hypothetical protein [Stieleria varia]TWU02444.1 hypothetical protein Pla52n_34940 [Stieleria varia]
MSMLFFFAPWVALIVLALVGLAVAAMKEKKNRPLPPSYESEESYDEAGMAEEQPMMVDSGFPEGEVQPVGDDFSEFDQQFG